MKGYRVTFIKPKVAELRSFELRKPKDNEVMVKVKYTLISAGTEKAYLSGANNTAQKFMDKDSVGYCSCCLFVLKL